MAHIVNTHLCEPTNRVWRDRVLVVRPLSTVSCEPLCVGVRVLWSTRSLAGGQHVQNRAFEQPNRFSESGRGFSSERVAGQPVEIGLDASRGACPGLFCGWRSAARKAGEMSFFQLPELQPSPGLRKGTPNSRATNKVSRTQFASFVHDVLLERVSVRRSSYQELVFPREVLTARLPPSSCPLSAFQPL